MEGLSEEVMMLKKRPCGHGRKKSQADGRVHDGGQENGEECSYLIRSAPRLEADTLEVQQSTLMSSWRKNQ
jgi:hypothetical protein